MKTENNSVNKSIQERAEAKYPITQPARRNAYISGATDERQLMSEEWIRVEDRLPEIGDKVLIYFGAIDNILMATVGVDYDGNVIFFGYYRDCYSCDHAEDITHWMPLPKPPVK